MTGLYADTFTRRKTAPTTLSLFPDLAPSIAPDKPNAPGDRYPQRPGFKGDHDGPGAAAAATIAPTVKGRRREVLDYLKRHTGPAPTADQIAVALGRSILSVRPRVAELRRLGLIEPDPTGRGRNESGMTASRWRATAAVAS